MMIAGFKTPEPGKEAELLENIDKVGNAWRGTKWDSDERRQIGQLLSTVSDVRLNDEVTYFVALAEDDGFFDGYIAGVVVIAIAFAILSLSGGTAAIVGAGWTAIMAKIAGDDLLGRTTLLATPVLMDERIAATHSADFLVNGTAFGPLPPAPGAVTQHQRANPFLIHPFADFKLGPPLDAQCNPGSCPSGETCMINRCVENGFVDPTAGKGFKERREFARSGYYYVVDLLWEKVRVP